MVQLLFNRGPVHDKVSGAGIRVPCGSAFTFANLSPGEYKVVGLALGPKSNGGFAWTANGASPVVVFPTRPAGDPVPRFAEADIRVAEGSDDDLDLTFESGFELTQRVACDCADGWQEKVQDATALGLASDGSYQKIEAPTGAVKVGITRLRAGFVIKEVLSNGHSTGGLFVPDRDSAAQTLTVVLTDQPAGVSAESDRVVMARWPLDMVDGFPDYQVVKAETVAIAPGAYRAVRVSDEDWARIEMPGVLEGLLGRGQEFTVAARENRVLQ
jgi:hypothetical protein